MPIRRVQRKPVTVEAIQFDGTVNSAREILAWAGEASNLRAVLQAGTKKPFIEVPDESGGVVTAGPLDWIIRLENGAFRVRSDAAFQTDYTDAPVTP
jgi:phosphoribosylcarboxyaminoimidazole (NCAIR) mutase